jgi:hypothetical protein
MFTPDFYPTPPELVYKMIEGYELHGKAVLEPSAGKGDLIKILQTQGANVIACEINEDLRTIVTKLCPVIENDFMKLTADKVSHIHFVVMNPPFSKDEKHILHAWDIAPAGCKIIALCNVETLKNRYYSDRKKLAAIVEQYGHYEELGDCFKASERKTNVEIALVHLNKPTDNYDAEFEGFYLNEEEEPQANGIMPYNAVRDLVNRYVAAVKLYDEQLTVGEKMQHLIGDYCKYDSQKDSLKCFTVTIEDKAVDRSTFKKQLQKMMWSHIFSMMKMNKYSTKGLKEDINKFVEQQQQIPFTMRNIYRMVEIVIGTTSQRMDKAILEVFDKLTEHYNENRFNVEGWKTNSHYLVNRKFILPYGAESNWSGKLRVKYSYNGELLTDVEKALCFLAGENYDTIKGINSMGDVEAGAWNHIHFFKVKAYKKGTIHCEFVSEDLWAKFNLKVCELKGYPLPESRPSTSHKEKKERKKQEEEIAKRYRPVEEPTTLF